MKYFFSVACLLMVFVGYGQGSHDDMADNMLVYQRSVGGWPKHIGNEKIDYKKKLSPAEKAALSTATL